MSIDPQVSLDSLQQGRPERGCSGPLCCIFSTAKSRTPGRGTTLRGHGRVHYWVVRQQGEDRYAVRGVDGDYLPFGEESHITAEELLRHYTPEVAVFEDRLLPSAKQRNYRLLATHRGSGVRRQLLAMDEANMRGLFELGMEYLLAGRATKGRNLLNELLRVRTPFPGKNQFLFNEFGINLRKIGYPEGAAICYRRALKYTDQDDHLHYNLARAFYDQGLWWDCMAHLGRCFELNPALPLARDLVVLIAALAENPALRRRYGKPPVPDGVARRADALCEAVFTVDDAGRRRAEERSLLAEAPESGSAGADEAGLWLPGRDAVGL